MPKMELKSCWTVLLTQDLFIIYCCFSIVSSSGPLTQDIILSPSEPVLICTSGYTVQDSTYILVNTVCRYPWGDISADVIWEKFEKGENVKDQENREKVKKN